MLFVRLSQTLGLGMNQCAEVYLQRPNLLKGNLKV